MADKKKTWTGHQDTISNFSELYISMAQNLIHAQKTLADIRKQSGRDTSQKDPDPVNEFIVDLLKKGRTFSSYAERLQPLVDYESR